MRKKYPIIQSHLLLADRINGMLRYLYSVHKPTEEQQKAIRDFNEQIVNHEHAYNITGEKFILIK